MLQQNEIEIRCETGSTKPMRRSRSITVNTARTRPTSWILIAFLSALPGALAQSEHSAIWNFVDVAAHSGIDFVHTDGSSGRRYVMESMTAGCAILDFDGDGWQDLYFINGSPLPGTNANRVLTNRLYRNLGGWKFVDVTQQAGLGDVGYGLGVVTGDYDNDGDSDIYITNYGKNRFYINCGDGTFQEAAHSLNVTGGNRFGAGACFFDMEMDGDLDLYCANYQKFTFDQHIVREIGGYQFHPGPADYPPEEDQLFRNDGNGSFTDVSVQSGIASVAGTGMGVVALDVEDDGDSDILVANDSVANFLFLNDGTGHFAEEAISSGLAFDRNGRPNGNMGIDVGDIDRDGLLDVFTTTYQNEMPVLYQNLGDGLFDDITNSARIPTSLGPHVNWGLNLADFDNDTRLDIFIACGHFMDNIAHIDDRTTMKVRNYVLRNQGGWFSDQSATSGSGLDIMESCRGTAAADLDHDGDIDLVVVNFNARTSVLENRCEPQGDWLQLNLVGTQCNRQAIGAKVKITTDSGTQIAYLTTGRSYQSSYGNRLHFGLGEHAHRAIAVEVIWPPVSRRPSNATSHPVESQSISLEKWNGIITIRQHSL